MGDAAGAPEGEPLAESPPVDEPVANDVVAEEPRAAGSEPEPERSEEEAGGQPQGRSNRVAPSDTGDSLTAEKSQAQSLMSGVEEKYIGQEDLDAARETILEEGQEVAGDLMGGAEGESLAGDDDYAVELRPASNQVFRAPAAGGAGGEDDGEDLFIRSTAQPEPEPAFVPHAKPAPEAEEPPAPEPPPPREAFSGASGDPLGQERFSGPFIGNPNIPDDDAPFGGLLPPANLTLIRKKPGRTTAKPSKNYPEVVTRRGITAKEIDENTKRAQRLSGELMGKNGRYVGNLRGGVPHGKGQLWLPTGPGHPERLAYEGDWNMGLQTGFGTLHLANGEEYNGEVDRGQMHGRGRFRYRSGDVFQGTWVRGRRSGEGRMQYAGGDIFVGTFDGAERRGYGVYYYVGKGCKLEGDWVGDKALCGAVQNLSPEETDLLNAAAEEWARSAIPLLRLAQPNRALFDALAAARPPAARTGRELSAQEMLQLRHAFAQLSRGEEPGKGIRAEDLRRVLRASGIAASLAEADLGALTALLEGTAEGARIELDAFLGVVVAFRAEAPAVGLHSTAAEEEARAARAALGGSAAMRGTAATAGMGGTVRAISPVRIDVVRRTMRASMATTRN